MEPTEPQIVDGTSVTIESIVVEFDRIIVEYSLDLNGSKTYHSVGFHNDDEFMQKNPKEQRLIVWAIVVDAATKTIRNHRSDLHSLVGQSRTL